MIKINDQQQKMLVGNLVAFATCNRQLIPNLIVVQVNKVINNNQIVFTDNFLNKTIENILENDQASISVWDSESQEGYQFKGKVEYFKDGELKEYIDDLEDNIAYAHKAAVLLTVTEIWDLNDPKLLAKA